MRCGGSYGKKNYLDSGHCSYSGNSVCSKENGKDAKGEEETIVSQRENLGQAEEAMQIAETRYVSGMITNLEFMDTQLALTQAKTAYLQALANYQIAKAKFVKAIGK